jgi:hypothetical protein
MPTTVYASDHCAPSWATCALLEAALLARAAKTFGEIVTIFATPESNLNETALARIASNDLP